MPIDFAKNAESLGAVAFRAHTEQELRDALVQAKAVDRTVLIYVPVQVDARVPGFESWWDVPVAEVSESESVRASHEEYVKNREKERYFL